MNKNIEFKNNKMIYVSMIIYLCAVIYVTFLLIDFTLDFKWLYHESIPVDYGNIVPFEDLMKNRGGAVENIVLNILMTILLGFFISIIYIKTNILKIVVKTFLFSLTIELIQLIMTIFLLYHRACDVTDLITNTIGGIIGYITYKLININGLISKLFIK